MYGQVYYALCIPVYPDVAAPTLRDYTGALVLLIQAESLTRSIPESALENILIADGSVLLSAPNQRLR